MRWKCGDLVTRHHHWPQTHILDGDIETRSLGSSSSRIRSCISLRLEHPRPSKAVSVPVS